MCTSRPWKAHDIRVHVVFQVSAVISSNRPMVSQITGKPQPHMTKQQTLESKCCNCSTDFHSFANLKAGFADTLIQRQKDANAMVASPCHRHFAPNPWHLPDNQQCPLFSARCRGLAWFSDPWRSYKLFRCDLPVLSIARKNEKHMFYLCWFGAVSPLETSLAYLSQCVLWCASFRNRSKKRGRAGLQQHQEQCPGQT